MSDFQEWIIIRVVGDSCYAPAISLLVIYYQQPPVEVEFISEPLPKKKEVCYEKKSSCRK